MVALVRFVYKKTIDYVEWMRGLRVLGPSEATEFLDFMVEQEELQVEMMRLALEGRHSEIAGCTEEFFLMYGGSAAKPGTTMLKAPKVV